MRSVLFQSPCDPERLRHRLEQTRKYEEAKTSMVHFWDCESAQQYRKLEREGKGVFDVPVYDPHAFEVTIPSTYRDHHITLRVIRPKTITPSKGVFMYIHGGGFVIGSASLHDNVLRDLAEKTGLTMVSVEYRLAPEFKLPAGVQDCIDAALFLLSPQSEQPVFGKDVPRNIRFFIGGESAGAYLTVQTTLCLRDEKGINVREKIAGLLPTYGIYDLSLLPSVRTARPPHPLSLTIDPIRKDEEANDGAARSASNFMELALPADVYKSTTAVKHPKWSPLYQHSLENLPPASFAVGTLDSLTDDSVLLAAKWDMAGNEAELIVYPGTPHGYLVVDLDVTKEAIGDIVAFVKRYI